MVSAFQGGLLGPSKSPAEIEQEEREYRAAEARIRKTLEIRRQLLGPLPVPLGGLLAIERNDFRLAQNQELARDERLLNFAVKRRMPLEGDWIYRALLWAAMEHDEIKSDPKRRGRKKKIRFGWAGQYGLLGPLKDEDEELLDSIESIRARLSEQGLPPTQIAAIEIYLIEEKGYSPKSHTLSAVIEATERKLGRIRRKMGKTLKPGTKSSGVKIITDK